MARTKKGLSLKKKPNPRTPAIIKVKIPNPKDIEVKQESQSIPPTAEQPVEKQNRGHKEIQPQEIVVKKESCDSVSITKSLSLSSSSSESVKLLAKIKLEEQLNGLRNKLDSLDLEFINWLGNDTDTVDVQNMTFEIREILADCINECEKFNQRILSNVTSSNDSERKTPDKSSPVREINDDKVDVVNIYQSENVVDNEIVATVEETNKNWMADNELDYNTCFKDDEDALSTVSDRNDPIDLCDQPKLENFKEETPVVIYIVPNKEMFMFMFIFMFMFMLMLIVYLF